MTPAWEIEERGLGEIATLIRRQKRDDGRAAERLAVRIEQVYAYTGSCEATMRITGCTYHDVYDALRRMEGAA